jgi:uncharacterized protein YcnI
MHHKLHTNQPQCNNGHQNHGNAISKGRGNQGWKVGWGPTPSQCYGGHIEQGMENILLLLVGKWLATIVNPPIAL